jgi:hypothetical protein
MDGKGDIPEKDEVLPKSAKRGYEQVNVIEEALGKGGLVHVYMMGRTDDIHLEDYKTHVWTDVRNDYGLIYTMVENDEGEEVEKWLFPEYISDIERHY